MGDMSIVILYMDIYRELEYFVDAHGCQGYIDEEDKESRPDVIRARSLIKKAKEETEHLISIISRSKERITSLEIENAKLMASLTVMKVIYHK